MTMILKKDFTSFNHRLFVVPVSVRAISFKSSPSGELSYYIKKAAGHKVTSSFSTLPGPWSIAAKYLHTSSASPI